MSALSSEETRKKSKVGKVIGGASAVIAFLITIGVIQSFRAPSVDLTTGGPLVMSYKPLDDQLEISFDLTFDNSGDGSEVIKSSNARLVHSVLPPGENYIPYTTKDLVFSEKTGNSQPSLTIDKESTKSGTLTLKHKPGGASTKIIETPGKLHLYINLFGKKRFLGMFGEANEYKLEFCFESDGSTLKSIGQTAKKFNSTSCS